jgi:hypothetical protein
MLIQNCRTCWPASPQQMHTTQLDGTQQQQNPMDLGFLMAHNNNNNNNNNNNFSKHTNKHGGKMAPAHDLSQLQ